MVCCEAYIPRRGACGTRDCHGYTQCDGIHRARVVVVVVDDDDDDVDDDVDVVGGEDTIVIVIVDDACDGDARETREEDGGVGGVVGGVFGVVIVGVARVWYGIERCVRCARRELARGQVLCERRREPMDDVVHWGVGG